MPRVQYLGRHKEWKRPQVDGKTFQEDWKLAEVMLLADFDKGIKMKYDRENLTARGWHEGEKTEDVVREKTNKWRARIVEEGREKMQGRPVEDRSVDASLN